MVRKEVRKKQLEWAIERNDMLIKNQKERAKSVAKDTREEISKLKRQQARARKQLKKLRRKK